MRMRMVAYTIAYVIAALISAHSICTDFCPGLACRSGLQLAGLAHVAGIDSGSQRLMYSCHGACRWAFSIWGLIFGLEGVGTIYQALPYGYNAEGTKQRIVNAIGAFILQTLRALSSLRCLNSTTGMEQASCNHLARQMSSSHPIIASIWSSGQLQC